MMKNHKKVTAGIMAGLCVLSSQTLAECGLFVYEVGGTEVFKDADGNLTGQNLSAKSTYNMNAVALNNGLLSFGISVENGVHDEQINFILKKSNIKMSDDSVPQINDLRNATDNTIKIKNVDSFFIENGSGLAEFQITATSQLSTEIQITEDDANKWQSYAEKFQEINNDGTLSENEKLNNMLDNIYDADIQQLQSWASSFINVAQIYNNQQPGTTLKNWIDGKVDNSLSSANKSTTKPNKFLYSSLAFTQSLVATSICLFDSIMYNNDFSNYTSNYSDAYSNAYNACKQLDAYQNFTINGFQTVIDAASKKVHDKQIATNIAVLAVVNAYYDALVRGSQDFKDNATEQLKNILVLYGSD